jgi:hypothetical protein
VEEIASDFAEMLVPVIWQICLHVDECASDFAELPVPMIWQFVEECARDFTEFPACRGECHASDLAKIACASDLADLLACGQVCQ